MSNGATPTILGLGYNVPKKVRYNDNPIFSYLNDLKDYEKNPFIGFAERRVLSSAQEMIHMMKRAAEDAMKAAYVVPDDIDMLLGCASISPNRGPTELTLVHQMLGLPEHALPEIVGNDFSNFNMALVFADALIRSGLKEKILIVIGGNWSRAVDYKTPQAISAADGAGAAVVGIPYQDMHKQDDRHKWHVVKEKAFVNSKNFGLMYMAGDSIAGQSGPRPREEPKSARWTSPYFHITAGGKAAFISFGVEPPANLANDLLDEALPDWLKDKLNAEGKPLGSVVTLIAHQASSGLMKLWGASIKPARFFSTIESYANMTVATYPVNLALALAKKGDKGYDDRQKLLSSPEKQRIRQMDPKEIIEKDYWVPDDLVADDLIREMRTREPWTNEEVATPYILLLALGYDMHAHALLLGNLDRIQDLKASMSGA